MTAESNLDKLVNAARRDRRDLIALLRMEQPNLAAELVADIEAAESLPEPDVKSVKPGVKSVKWTVNRQYSNKPEHPMCGHRFELFADLCAYRRTARHPRETGVHFTVRRADA